MGLTVSTRVKFTMRKERQFINCEISYDPLGIKGYFAHFKNKRSFPHKRACFL